MKLQYKDVLAKRDGILSQMDEIEERYKGKSGADAAWSAEDKKAYDAHQESLEAVSEELSRIGKRQAAEIKGVAGTAADASVQAKGGYLPEPVEGTSDEVGHLGTYLRSLSRQADPASVDPLSLTYRGPETWNEEYRILAGFGEFMIDVAKAARGDLTEKMQAHLQASGDATGQAGAQGGFLIQQDIGGMLYDQMLSQSPFLSRARIVPLSSGSRGIKFWAVDAPSRQTGSRWGGVSANWTGEKRKIKESAFPDLEMVTMELHKIAALCRLPDELMEDAAAAAAMFLLAVRDEINFLVEDSIFRGNGIAKPVGFLDAPCTLSCPKETSQSPDSFVWENISQMWMRLHSRSKPRGVWFYNYELGPWFDKLAVDGVQEDRPRFISYGPTGMARAKGRPMVEAEYASAAGDVGDIVLADLSQYLVIMGPVQQNASIHLYFDTAETAFRLTLRIDGKPGWISPLTPYKGSVKMSPFVKLAARA